MQAKIRQGKPQRLIGMLKDLPRRRICRGYIRPHTNSLTPLPREDKGDALGHPSHPLLAPTALLRRRPFLFHELDLATTIRFAVWAHMVRQTWLAALWTGHQLGNLHMQMAAPLPFRGFGYFSFW
jgi:hypothetical protein